MDPHRHGTYTQHGFTRRTYIYIFLNFFYIIFIIFFLKIMYIVLHTISYMDPHRHGIYTQQKGCSHPNHEMKPKCENQIWADARFSHCVAHGRDSAPKSWNVNGKFHSSTFATRASPRTKLIEANVSLSWCLKVIVCNSGVPQRTKRFAVDCPDSNREPQYSEDHTLTNMTDVSWKFGKKSGINSSVPKHCELTTSDGSYRNIPPPLPHPPRANSNLYSPLYIHP